MHKETLLSMNINSLMLQDTRTHDDNCTEMMAPQLYELQYGHYTFYNLTDGHHTKCLNF